MSRRRPLTVLCDFDGTITTRDIGQALCDRFAPGILESVNLRWRAGELTFAAASRLAWRELKAPAGELVQHALDSAVVRPGFDEMLDACDEAGARVVVASAGLDLYVEPILRRHLGDRADRLELHVNLARPTADGLEVEFPHQHPDCADCANCKGRRARAARAEGHEVLAIGDSFSDRCVAKEADTLFARDWLREHCREAGLPHEPWEHMADITRHLRSRRPHRRG